MFLQELAVLLESALAQVLVQVLEVAVVPVVPPLEI
jgi:hypothetical protein